MALVSPGFPHEGEKQDWLDSPPILHLEDARVAYGQREDQKHRTGGVRGRKIEGFLGCFDKGPHFGREGAQGKRNV